MTRSQRYLWLSAVILLAVVCTIVGLSHIVTQPWQALPDMGGDGAKNNLTYLYHSAHGKGYWFDGMNYPYGEHIVFTDGMPLLSVFFAAIGNVSYPVALTVLWWMLGLSHVLSCVYLYKLLLKLTGEAWFAMVAALLILFLTPQTICIRGHYALAFTCVIPMFFYWTYMYHTTKLWRYCVYIFLLGIVSAFLHPYYAGMLLVWAAFYSIGCFFFVKTSFKQRLWLSGRLMASAISVALVVMVTLKLTDPIKDRPVMPYDPLDSYTNLPQVLSAYFSPFWKYVVDHAIVPGAADGGEGFSYLGFVPIVILLAAFVLAVYRMVTKRRVESGGDTYSIWLFVAVAALVFSMGIPFIWNMQWLKDYLPVFRQFRALGRFVWIFYYVITVIAAAIMYGWFAQLLADGRKPVAYTLMALALLTWGIEVKGYMQNTRKIANDAVYYHELTMQTREQDWASFLQEHKLKKEAFQALLLLRFFHVGTEKIWVGEGGWLLTLGSRAALQLQLPIIDVMLSRSSWGQAQKQVKLVAGPYAGKPMLAELRDNRPFLLMKLNTDSLSPDEAYLLEASEYIGEFSQCKIYACYPDRITDNDILHAEEVNEILPYMEGQDTCVGANTSYSVLHFDDVTNSEKLVGRGAMNCIKGKDSVIAVLPVMVAADSVLYEYSCWFLLAKENYYSPEVRLELLDGTGRVLSATLARTNQSTDSYHMWFRASQYFYIPAGCRQVRCTLLNSPGPSYKAMDEMLLRPAEAVVISKDAGGSIMVNGHVFKMGK